MKRLCLECNVELVTKKINKNVVFKDSKLDVEYEADMCPQCHLVFASLDQTAKLEMLLADTYRLKNNLMTSLQIKKYREDRKLTQDQLAKLLDVGVASIKRWEAGLVQSRSMDNLLKSHLLPDNCCLLSNNGGREFSIPRVKLVLRQYEKVLGKSLLTVGDRFLYSAKYLWYADMLSFKESGKSMTGAIYASLPQGPQLNNYRDLVKNILACNEEEAEILSEKEIGIINRLAKKFPQPAKAYHASHQEDAWRNTPIGTVISYRLATTISIT